MDESFLARMPAGEHQASLLDEDLPLLEGENPNLREEAAHVLGSDWLKEPNSRLGGLTPDQMISDHHGASVRNIVRSVKYSVFA